MTKIANFPNQTWPLKIRIITEEIQAANRSMVEIGKSREIILSFLKSSTFFTKVNFFSIIRKVFLSK